MDGRWLLIPHAQHARIAATIARSLGGEIAPPTQIAALAQALALQNSGLQAFDAKPPLNLAGEPAGHDEIPLPVLLDAWSFASSTTQTRPAAAMMLSLLSLQRSAALPMGSRSSRELFLINRHQQNEIARQQTIRPTLGIRSDIDLAQKHQQLEPQERDLLYDYRLLLLVSQLALDICLKRERDYPPVQSSPGGPEKAISARWMDDQTLGLTPFPLAGEITVEVVGKLVPFRSFDHELELHEFLETAETLSLQVRLAPGGPQRVV